MDSTILLVTSLSAHKKDAEKEATTKFVDSLHFKEHEQNHVSEKWRRCPVF